MAALLWVHALDPLKGDFQDMTETSSATLRLVNIIINNDTQSDTGILTMGVSDLPLIKIVAHPDDEEAFRRTSLGAPNLSLSQRPDPGKFELRRDTTNKRP